VLPGADHGKGQRIGRRLRDREKRTDRRQHLNQQGYRYNRQEASQPMPHQVAAFPLPPNTMRPDIGQRP
jgi:hypothetical protein